MDELRAFWNDEEGAVTVEVILILLVLIALVLLFKKQLLSVVENILDKVTTQTDTV